MFSTQRKKKRGYVHQNEKEEDEGGFPFGVLGGGGMFSAKEKKKGGYVHKNEKWKDESRFPPGTVVTCVFCHFG